MTFESLMQKTKKRRIIEGILFLSFVAAAILFSILYANSRVDTIYDHGIFGSYVSTDYNYNYGFAVLFFVIPAMITGTFLLVDVLLCGVLKIKIGDDDCLIDSDLRGYHLYINGNKQDTMGGRFKTYLTGKLSDGTIATFSRNGYSAFHITFSDGRSACELYK